MSQPRLPESYTYQFDVEGMTCAACVANVESALATVPGVLDISVNLATESASVTSSVALPIQKLTRSVSKMGYRLAPQGTTSLVERQQRTIATWRRLLILQTLFGVPLLIYAMLEMFHLIRGLEPLLNISIQFLLASVMVITGAGYYKRGFKHLILRVPNMDTLVALGTGSAFLYSIISSLNLVFGWSLQGFETLYFEAAGTILLFITLGKWLEAVARGKTTEALTGLMEQMPTEAEVWRQDVWVVVPLDQVQTGDRIRVRPHTRIPVDGEVILGSGSVDESTISGESLPVEKQITDSVIGASMNLQSSLEIRALKIGRESVFGQVIKLVEEAQTKKPEIQRLVDRIAAVFVPVVLALALISGSAWLVLGFGITFALNVMISVMIIACPCALGLATPTALVVASGLAAKSGILIKSVDAFQQLSRMSTLLMDKTGTLTESKIRVVAIWPEDQTDFLAEAMGLEAHSQHPLAQPLIAYGEEMGLQAIQFSGIAEQPGFGLGGKFAGQHYSIRKLAVDDTGEGTSHQVLQEWLNQGYIVSGIFMDQSLQGMIAYSDTMKAEAPMVIAGLKKLGVTVHLATGDKVTAAAQVASRTGIHMVHAGLLPADKHQLVHALQADGQVIGMLGDGINDAPALASADVGLSFRGSTDIAMNAADIIFMNDSLTPLLTIRRLSTATMNKIRQNLFWAFIYNLIGIPIAMGVLYPITGILLNPMFAGMAMAFSSVSVVTNTLLLKRRKF